MSDVVVIGSPVSVGHVRPLMPLAKRLVERGFTVIWAISGDGNEPASLWNQPITELGVQFLDLDSIVKFDRVVTDSAITLVGLSRRVIARANDVSAAAADAIRAAAGDRRIVAGVLDFFALWSYVAMKRLGVPHVSILVSAFPTLDFMDATDIDDPVYQRELKALQASGGVPDRPLLYGIIPVEPSVRLFAATSRHVCSGAHASIHLLGVPRETLPASAGAAIPAEHQSLVRRLQGARREGARVLLLSMGSLVHRFGPRLEPGFAAFARRLYTTLAAAALRTGAIVVASTTGSSAEALGLDEATLGPAARERLISMPFVPQPLLFAHGLVDAMLMHGGANTFHETVLAGIPTLVCPVMGDQSSVARAVMASSVGVAVETLTIPDLPGARSVESIASDTLPAMLSGDNRWKQSAMRIARLLASEDGITAQVAFVLGDQALSRIST
jgi:UDP:flavonoid glycosyltransferase YjiC (YdhE family)